MSELDGLRNHFAVTLQTAIGKLGPMPDSYGDLVRETLNGTDPVKIIMLGLGLEEAMKAGFWVEDLDTAGLNAGGDL